VNRRGFIRDTARASANILFVVFSAINVQIGPRAEFRPFSPRFSPSAAGSKAADGLGSGCRPARSDNATVRQP
jgi:hypothetical protein